MKIRILSDIHQEINPGFYIQPEADDKDSILILAGDFCPVKKHQLLEGLLKDWSNQFRKVLCVFGNHEYYRGSVTNAHQKFNSILDDQQITNVHLLDRGTYEEDSVLFVGATLWTDFDKGNPSVMFDAQNAMTDYRVIRSGPPSSPYHRRITLADIMRMHIRDRDWIFDTLENNKGRHRYTVVITHHGPSWQSVGPQYIGGSINGAYVSDLSEQILDAQPDLWVHGHTHHSAEYMIGNTKVIINPHGYGNENPNFDPTLFMNI